MNPDAKSNIRTVVPYLNLKDVIEDIPVVTRMKLMKDVRKSVEVVSKIGELQPCLAENWKILLKITWNL